METTTNRERRLRKNRRGLSNIIVVVLSLVIIVVIVSNVILWSYQMTQLDWEKMQENLTVANVSILKYSTWFVAKDEYQVNQGVQINGSHIDTQAIDSRYESFRESPPLQLLDINGTFSLDLTSYPLAYIQGIEIQLRYKVDNEAGNLNVTAYDWTLQRYLDIDFNSTVGNTPSLGWTNYAANLTSKWPNYVRSDGTILVKVQTQGLNSTLATIDIDFLAVRAALKGAVFVVQNRSSLTAHLVSIWINNSTQHRRYPANALVDSGETLTYERVDISLPNGQYLTKIVTERGNAAIYLEG